MNLAINIFCQPTPRMSGALGLPILVQTDEAGQVLGDEAGNILTPDPIVITGQADENNVPLTNENAVPILPDPEPGA